MSSSTSVLTAAAAPARASTSARNRIVLLTIAAVLCGQLAVTPQLSETLSLGAWPDTDDAMRMVQVRNLMGGQGWFDLTEWRLDPPAGVFSHWSRLIDAPILLLVKFFGFFFAADMAERVARVAYPLILTGVLYAAAMHLTREAVGKGTALFGLLAIFLSVPFELQFQPGRIDHHSAQIILLTAMVAGAIGSLRAPRMAAFSAVAFVVSLAISLENLPFAPIVATPVVLWLIDGDSRARERLLWFAGAIAIAAPAVLAITVAPSRWPVVVVDAMSGAHVAALVIGAACCAIMALAGERLVSAWARMIAAAVLTGAALAAVALLFPGLLRSPFADVDPLVRERWLDQVSEVLPIYVTIRNDPLMAIATITPLLIGFAGALIAALRTAGAERRGWIMLAIPLGIGVACLFWMVRIAYSASPLAIPGLVWLGLCAQRRAAARTKHAGRFAAFALFILATSAPAVSAVGQPLMNLSGGALKNLAPKPAASPTASCYTPEIVGALRALPKGVILGDIDFGPFILAETQHSVVAGPYHRNNHGNRLLLEAKDASPAELRKLMREAKADYIVFCRGDTESWKTSAEMLEREIAVNGASDMLAPVAVASAALAVFRAQGATR